jgi:hypothetical protein
MLYPTFFEQADEIERSNVTSSFDTNDHYSAYQAGEAAKARAASLVN